MPKHELIEVLTAQSEKTGRVLDKAAVHQQGLWHSGVNVWIYNQHGDILLQRRANTKDIYPDKWDISAAGHITAGDTPAQTAIRETEEELGIRLKPGQLVFVGLLRTVQRIEPNRQKSFVHRVFDYTYITRWDGDPHALHLQEDEVAEVAWWPRIDFYETLHNTQTAGVFAPRSPYVYDLAITEISAALEA